MATGLWNEINYVNLKENILPTRERASLILTKSEKHAVDQIRLRKVDLRRKHRLIAGFYWHAAFAVFILIDREAGHQLSTIIL